MCRAFPAAVPAVRKWTAGRCAPATLVRPAAAAPMPMVFVRSGRRVPALLPTRRAMHIHSMHEPSLTDTYAMNIKPIIARPVTLGTL